MAIIRVGEFEVGKVYLLAKDSFYAGHRVKIIWISKTKNIAIGENKTSRQVECKVLFNDEIINVSLSCLEQTIDSLVSIKDLPKSDIIKLARDNNREGVKEFIRRFRRPPVVRKNA